mmetsp:Transcript_5757/g.9419  ORF Transcript_5757/g.9419 Transcript_5757/m.9419 type:complete len:80 (+) Transcript_5757:49-288(+)
MRNEYLRANTIIGHILHFFRVPSSDPFTFSRIVATHDENDTVKEKVQSSNAIPGHKSMKLTKTFHAKKMKTAEKSRMKG